MKSTVLLPLLLLPSAAIAGDGAIDLGLAAGGTWTDSLEVLGSSPSFSPRVGYWVNETMALEADLGFAMGQTRVGTPDTFPFMSLTPRVNLIGKVWPDKALNILFAAGLGVWYKKIDDDGALALPQGTGGDIDLLGNAGPGLMVPLGNSPLALRTDLRWMLSLGSENWENHGDAFMNWEWTGGIAIVLGGPKDTDKDGITDDLDQCIDKAEDMDGLGDEDGCPEDDFDGDGVADAQDQCNDQVEDKDNFKDDDGCLDDDNDGDGIADTDDACPYDTGMASAKGCPDMDEDGIVDSIDECERDAGPDTAFGCPDGDGDRIPDYRDMCKSEAGASDASPFLSNGCATRVYPGDDGVHVAERVQFQGTKIKQASNLLVDEISEVIKAVDAYKKLEIRVYAEGARGDATGLKNAQARADALLKVIVDDGNDAARVTAKGVDAPEDLPGNVNVFVAALEAETISGYKRKYEDEPKKQEGTAPRPAPGAETPAPAPAPAGGAREKAHEDAAAKEAAAKEAAPAPAPEPAKEQTAREKAHEDAAAKEEAPAPAPEPQKAGPAPAPEGQKAGGGERAPEKKGNE